MEELEIQPGIVIYTPPHFWYKANDRKIVFSRRTLIEHLKKCFVVANHKHALELTMKHKFTECVYLVLPGKRIVYVLGSNRETKDFNVLKTAYRVNEDDWILRRPMTVKFTDWFPEKSGYLNRLNHAE